MAGRLKVLLVVLDGLADRPSRLLDGRTPLAAAVKPNLDEFSRRGVNGIMYPLAPGLAPSSEMAHMALLGYGPEDFPGRGYLEALGMEIPLQPGEIAVQANLSSVNKGEDGLLYIRERDPECSRDEGDALFANLEAGLRLPEPFRLRFHRQTARNSLMVLSGGAVQSVTDQDTLAADCPIAASLPLADAEDMAAAARTAAALNDIARQARGLLAADGQNAARAASGRPPIDFLLLKWAGAPRTVRSFPEKYGMKAAMLCSSTLFMGLARYIGIEPHFLQGDGPADDLAGKFEAAKGLFRSNEFVLVHTKAPDEAAHSKDPAAKREAIEQLDTAFDRFVELPDDLLLVVTSDHATPSEGPLVHSGEPVPLLFRAATTGADLTADFNEASMSSGSLGTVSGRDLMPLALNYSNRTRYMGSRPYPVDSPASPTASTIVPLKD